MTKSQLRVVIFGGIVLQLFALAENAKAKTSESVEQGKVVYENNCVACHGSNGDGRGPASRAIAGAKPRDFVEGKFKYGNSPDEVLKTVTKGIEGTAMPPWNTLSEQDRKAVVHYILSLKK